MARGFSEHVADMCGVTKAGLEFLLKLEAAGPGRARKNEAIKLRRDGFIQPTLEFQPTLEVWGRYEITDAGRSVVSFARALGWAAQS